MTASTATDREGLATIVEQQMEEWSVPGIAVGRLRAGEIAAEGFGVRSLETGQPVTPATLFQIGSITKVFTTTLVMTLVDEGKLDLDTPVIQYRPDLRLADEEALRTITLRHLLTHTSGLEGDYFNQVGPRYGFGDDALDREIADFPELRQMTRPGEIWAYCNAGFHLASAIVERVLGQKYEAAMRERVFEPLSLERTFFFAHEAITYPVAVGHTQKEPGSAEHEIARVYPRPRSAHAAGAIISTVGDLLRFARMHLEGGSLDGKRVLSEASVRAMQTPQTPAGNFADHYGLGWALQTIDGATVVSHGGTTNGFQAQLALVPARGYAIAILTNSSRGAAAYRPILHWALEHDCGLHQDEPEPISLSLDDLARFAGHYESSFTKVDVTPDDGGLCFVVVSKNLSKGTETAQPPFSAVPISETRFMVTEGDATSTRIDFIPGQGDAPRFVRLGGRLCARLADAAAPEAPNRE